MELIPWLNSLDVTHDVSSQVLLSLFDEEYIDEVSELLCGSFFT